MVSVAVQRFRKSRRPYRPSTGERMDPIALPSTADGRRSSPWTGSGARDQLKQRGPTGTDRQAADATGQLRPKRSNEMVRRTKLYSSQQAAIQKRALGDAEHSVRIRMHRVDNQLLTS